MIAEDLCPDCGSKQPANTPAGLCPQCLLRLGLGMDLDVPMGSGVLTTLDESIGPVPARLAPRRAHRRSARSSTFSGDARPIRPSEPISPDGGGGAGRDGGSAQGARH